MQTLRKLLQAMGEELELRAVPGPSGNQSIEELRADFEQLTAAERIREAAELSYALTMLAGSVSARS